MLTSKFTLNHSVSLLLKLSLAFLIFPWRKEKTKMLGPSYHLLTAVNHASKNNSASQFVSKYSIALRAFLAPQEICGETPYLSPSLKSRAFFGIASSSAPRPNQLKVKMVWICGRNKKKGPLMLNEDKTSLKQKFCYGVGHVFNDLCIQAWFTYLIIFFNKIVKISATGTGYIFLSSQIADAISTPFIGYGCDKSLSKRITKKYGNRKIWHLLGSAGIALIWPFVFSPCLLCNEESPDWVPVAYYCFFAALFSVGWPMVEISHLSLIPHVAKRPKDAVELSAIR